MGLLEPLPAPLEALGSLAGGARDLQPHKQTLLEPELMVEEPGGQRPVPPWDGGRQRPGTGGPAAPRSCMLGVGWEAGKERRATSVCVGVNV